VIAAIAGPQRGSRAGVPSCLRVAGPCRLPLETARCSIHGLQWRVIPSVMAAYNDEHLVAYPIEYIAGIDLYNAGEFHAAHDAWEERWMGPVAPDERLFLQAMIQSAVAFHHLQIGRPGAARRMYLMAKEKFARLDRQVFMSLDLEDYQAQLDRALSWLLSVPDPRELEPPKVEPPVIRLLPGVTAFE
jgi:predicted metal-dependent hydrolase